MLEEKNDNLSPLEGETDGNVENTVQQDEVQPVVAEEVEESTATIEEESNENLPEVVEEAISSVEDVNNEIEATQESEAITLLEKESNETLANEIEEAPATIVEEVATEKVNEHQDVLNAIDESNAEESEDETLKDRHEIPMLDYASLSMEVLVSELEKLAVVDKVMSVKDHVEEIKKEFLGKY